MKIGNYDESPELPYKVGCGGVVMRRGDNGLEVLCLYRSKERFGMRGDSYHLPKGTLEPGETLEECALREVQEESGAECEVIAYIGATTTDLLSRSTDYTINYTRHFFLMSCLKQHEIHDEEHERADWLPVEKAVSELAKLPKDENLIVERAVHFISQNDTTL